MSTTAWLIIFEEGDEVIVNGEIMYLEKKAKPDHWLAVLTGNRNRWWCYDGYGEDRLVKESDMMLKEQ